MATVLVIACPHALGLAIPLVVAISTTMGAQNGILVRDRLALEEARQINTVIFDKTGTLTEGRFGVVAMQTAEDWNKERALALALAIEGDSEHPIARGIRQKAEDTGVQPISISDFEAIKGRGIKATYNEQTVYVGGPRLLEMLELELSSTMDQFRQQANENAQTVVYMVVENQIATAFALADVVREESQQAIRHLHKMDVEVAMLTGDSQHVAEAVAHELGIDTIFAEVFARTQRPKSGEATAAGQESGDGRRWS